MGAEVEAGRPEKYTDERNKLGRRKETAWKCTGCVLRADVQLWAETLLLKKQPVCTNSACFFPPQFTYLLLCIVGSAEEAGRCSVSWGLAAEYIPETREFV